MIKHPDTNQANRWLCIAYAFPPILRSGTHRTLGFVRELSRLGWNATVLTVRPHGEATDESLGHEIPTATRIARAPWLDPIDLLKRADPRNWFSSTPRTEHHHAQGPLFAPTGSRSNTIIDWLTAWFKTPDSRIGWIAPGVITALDAVRRDKPKLIYSTSPYPSAHLIALILREITRLPWVADFRDPWRGNPFNTPLHPAHDRWDNWLESAVLNRAAHVICNTPTMTKALQARKSSINAKCSTILNGFDRQRYDGIVPRRVVEDHQISLVHAGQFYGPRSPIPWFRALAHTLRAEPNATQRLRLVLLGGNTFEGRSLQALAQQAGVRDQVCILGNQCHDTALSIMAGAEALALAGAAGPGANLQIPNKLFECLALRRPIIANVTTDSPVRSILDAADARHKVCDPRDTNALTGALMELARGDAREWSGQWTGVDQFDRTHAARQLREIFDIITNPKPRTAPKRSSALRGWISPPRAAKTPKTQTASAARDTVRLVPSR